jgi:translocation and assembly module TamB
MSGQPPENQGSEHHHSGGSPRRSRRWLWYLLSLGGGAVLVGGIVATLYIQRFIAQELAPLIADSLSNTFSRPVKVGKVERISLTSLRLGASSLPPTAEDADQVKVEAIEVRFNLLEALWSRNLHLDLTLIRPDIFVDQDEEGQWVKTSIKEEESDSYIKTKLDEIRFQDGRLVLAAAKQLKDKDDVEKPNTAADIEEDKEDAGEARVLTRLTIANINGNTTLRNDNQRIRFNITGDPDTGGELRLKGDLNRAIDSTKLTVEAQNLLAPTVSVVVPLPVTLLTGRASGKLDVEFAQEEGVTPFVNGTIRFRDAGMKIPAVPNTFNRLRGGLRFKGHEITFQDVRGRYGEIPASAQGGLDTDKGYFISARVPSVTAATLLKTFDLKTPVPVAGVFGGQIKVGGAIASPRLTGIATSLEPARVDQITLAKADTRFTLTPTALTFNDIRATPTSGGRVTGTGTIQFGDRQGLVFDFQGQDLDGDAIARDYGSTPAITIGSLSATAQVFGPFDSIETIARWQAPQATYPARGTVAFNSRNSDRIRFTDTAALVAGGMVRGEGELRQRQWNAAVETSGIQLSQFSPELRGLLSGTGKLSGSLDDLSLGAIAASGDLRFSEGISLITDPMRASVTWLGDRLRVDRATATGFNADGFVFAQLEGTPGITNLDLNVQLRDYAVTDLPIPTTEQIALGGTTDFDGKLTGNPADVTVVGRLGLNGARVNQLAFESALTGQFQYRANQFTQLDVAGANDRIALKLDGLNRPVSFFVKQGDAIATGKGEGDRLLADLQNFPLALLDLSPASAYGLGEVAGNLNGRFDINLADLSNPTVLGEVAIAAPAIGYINAESLTANFRYINGLAVLNQGELRRGNSRYQISGNFNLATTQFQGQVTTDQGRIEDILSALQWFDFEDIGRGVRSPVYGTAADIPTVPVGNPQDRFINQLRRFSEVVALRQQLVAARRDASIIPDLEDLRGQFSGNVKVGYSPQEGLGLDFGLKGQDWKWQQYQVNQITAGGSFKDGVLSLLPSRLESGDSWVTFQGQVGANQANSGQLVAQNIPAAAIRDLFKLTTPVEGGINLNVGLGGTLGNPEVSGEINLTKGKVNQSPVPDLGVILGYKDARLRVFGKKENPFTLVGDVPYKFPFMTVEPSSDQFDLKVNIENEGLKLLSLFTDQVKWQGGEGKVNLQVNGTLRTTADSFDFRPTATGVATFKDARISSASLPEDITNLTGDVLFANDRIRVKADAQFSRGRLTAEGVLPILSPLAERDPDSTQPLLVNLDNIALRMKDLFSGGVNGQVTVKGTALAPLVGGKIDLSNGRVMIASSEPAAGPVATEGTVTSPRLDNLELTLGDRLRVTMPPILNFYARGKLNINGPLDGLRAQGTVRLRGGQVNLFATQFNLAQGYDSKATFDPNRGLDPILDVRLVTSVPEVVRFPVPDNSPFAAAEVRDTTINDFGEIQTVRVQASVTGPASEFAQNLRLTSSPSRTESELVALVGGNFVNSLGAQGNAPLALASVAGSALLSDLQNLVANTVGLSDFRIFPTTVLSENSRNSTLAIAGEMGFDVTRDLSVSLLQILTVQEPTQFNVRYRVNDNILLRGTTNFEGDNRAVVEFETRF